MATTVMNIRMDSELKKQFEAFCADMGLSVTAAVTVFAKKAVREYRIPFEIGAEIPNAEKPLPEKHRDHALSGDYIGCREFHITTDWLLIYEISHGELTLCLTRTGTHSDLFD